MYAYMNDLNFLWYDYVYEVDAALLCADGN